jgi:hypothetical protein
MNLNAYDSVNPTFTTTWIVPKNQKLYSYVIPYYHNYTFLKKYNNNTKCNDYYIAFSNNPDGNRKWYSTYRTKSKAIKVDLSSIWHDKVFDKIDENVEVNLIVDNTFDDGIVYRIEL